MLRWNLANELIQRGQFFKNLAGVIVTRNRKIVWKHRPNRPFYELMLTTKLYYNPFFPTLHQNINKPKSRAFGLCYGPIFLPIGEIFISFFSFLGQDVIKPGSNSAIIACDLSRSTNQHHFTRVKDQKLIYYNSCFLFCQALRRDI